MRIIMKTREELEKLYPKRIKLPNGSTIEVADESDENLRGVSASNLFECYDESLGAMSDAEWKKYLGEHHKLLVEKFKGNKVWATEMVEIPKEWLDGRDEFEQHEKLAKNYITLEAGTYQISVGNDTSKIHMSNDACSNYPLELETKPKKKEKLNEFILSKMRRK